MSRVYAFLIRQKFMVLTLVKKLLGEALKPFRKEVVIASKIGFDIDFETAQMKGGLNSKPQHIKQAVDFMLKRLQANQA